jgi:tRNA A-37 threonylcarbamoyl transferase component Bud32
VDRGTDLTLQPGQTILNGKYHILHLIGEGGMARVWLAEELTFGSRQVALKQPRDDLLPDLAQEVRLRYQREVQVCAALERAKVPNIVRAITAEPYDESVLLVMEYMPGGDLAALLKQHPEGLPVDRAVSITLDILRALEGVHAHDLEIVHRDVKPSNVLFDEIGTAHLADFGLAQLAGSGDLTRLHGGGPVGTPMYAAPEQGSHMGYLTPAADLYALGCVLFEMLTGLRYKDKQVRPGTVPSALRPEVPGWLDEAVTRALAEDPWERYVAAAKMAAALRRGLAQAAEAQKLASAERLYTALQAAIDARDWAAALIHCDELRRVEPGYRDAANLCARAEIGLQKQQQAKEKAQARQAKMADYYGNAKAAMREVKTLARGTPIKARLALWIQRATAARDKWGRAIPTRSWLFLLAALTGLAVLIAIGPWPKPVLPAEPILFTSNRDGKREVYRLTNNGLEKLTSTPGAAESWSPAAGQGGSVLFTSNRDGKREVYRLTNNGLEKLTSTPGAAESWSPAAGPAGSVLFTSNRDGKREVYRLTVDGTERLTSTPGFGESWSPNAGIGGSVLFTSNRALKQEVYRLSKDGLERLTYTPGFGESWSPAPGPGGSVLFTSDREGKREIYALTSQSPLRLTYTPDGGESWSPVSGAGAVVLFTSNRDGKEEVYRLSGGTTVRLTNTHDEGVSWIREWEID